MSHRSHRFSQIMRFTQIEESQNSVIIVSSVIICEICGLNQLDIIMRQIRKLLFAFAGMLFPTMAAAETLPVIQNVNAYESLSLNGEWNYIVDVQEEGY